MQLSTILLGCILLFKIGVSSHKIEFPVETCKNALATGNFALCTNELASSIFKWHQWGANTPHKICGIPCTGKLKGRFSKWEWKWDGQFRCASKAPGVVGEATTRSRNGAMEWAIKDFLNKGIAAGQIKPEDFKCCEGNLNELCGSNTIY